ncbi:MAG: hypothetical protein Q4A11_07165 [Brachymonas sp.]|nr:hypothetical protein [Brachymonas sp.]
MNTSVRWMHSGMQGAPVLDNNWGDLTAMLRACCVTGFNVRPIQSITCQGTKATIQCAGHGYLEHQVVQIENATPAGYNGAHRVVSVEGANTLTIELEAELPEAQAVPGQTLQMRTAPLGWESLFDDGGQKLVLRSTDPQSTRNVLRVDDSCPAGYTTTWAKFGRVTMAQNMSDLDTFIGARAPFDPSDPMKNEVPKGSGSSIRSGWLKWYYAMAGNAEAETYSPRAGARNWVLIGDGRGFFFGNSLAEAGAAIVLWHFGDVDSLQRPDACATLLTAVENDGPANTSGSVFASGSLVTGQAQNKGRLLLRDYTGEGAPVRCNQRSLDVGSYAANWVSGGSDQVPFPNGPGNGLLVHPVWLQQENRHLRGRLRGAYHLLNKPGLGHLSIVDGVAGLPGRKMMLVDVRTVVHTNGVLGALAFDITGPWS